MEALLEIQSFMSVDARLDLKSVAVTNVLCKVFDRGNIRQNISHLYGLPVMLCEP